MKLSKVYSNKPFKNVEFNTKQGGLNVIMADIQNRKSEGDTHNLGKSTLVEIIDFLLLKKIDKKRDWLINTRQKGKSLFEDYEFYLELLLNNNQYLTIKRTAKTPTKISFKLHETKSKGFLQFQTWDIENIAFDKAKKLLNEYLNFDFFEHSDYNYRKSVTYSLRSQSDYNDIFQLSKFRGKHKDWKPFLFSLLGFSGHQLLKKYNFDDEISEEKKVIKLQEQNFGLKGNEKDSILGKIDFLEIEKKRILEELDAFNFYKEDKSKILDLVQNIETQISELNTALYNIEFDIQKIKKSIQNETSFDLDNVKSLFEEVEVYFPKQLANNYQDLINFNKKITSERNKLLKQTLLEKQEERQSIDNRLIELHQQKEQYKDLIQDNNFFKKYKVYQRTLMEQENEIGRLKGKLDALDIINSRKEEIKKLEKNQEEIVENLKKITDNTLSNTFYSSIRRTFSDIVRKVLKAIGVLSVSINKQGNIEFNYNIEETEEARGFTYKKLLCVAFDLAILINYRSQSYFRFVYHDDVFANQDNRLKKRLLKVIREICQKHDIQYILTIIKDELPRNDRDELMIFNDDEIILKLHDQGDEGKLFLMSF